MTLNISLNNNEPSELDSNRSQASLGSIKNNINQVNFDLRNVEKRETNLLNPLDSRKLSTDFFDSLMAIQHSPVKLGKKHLDPAKVERMKEQSSNNLMEVVSQDSSHISGTRWN